MRLLIDNENESQGTQYNITSANKGAEVAAHGRIYQSGHNDDFPLLIAKESTVDDCKPQGTAKWTLDLCPRANEL